MRLDGSVEVAPPRDYGLFGPGSVAWKVFMQPMGLPVVLLRNSVVEMLEPFVLAAVTDTGAVLRRTAVRYDRSVQYILTVVFGDGDQVVKAADVLMRIHSGIRGIEPVSGLSYDANDPEGQLWILLTTWHSVLFCYERFGSGSLTEEEELQYWAECRRAAEFQTIDPDAVPRNRAEMRAYWERMRPRLAVTDTTVQVVEHYLRQAAIASERMPAFTRPVMPAFGVAVRKATIATLPRWLRRLAGIDQSAAEDAAAIALMRAVNRAVPQSPRVMLEVLRVATPRTAKVLESRLSGIPPLEPVVVTPAEAWARAQKKPPRQQYAELLAIRSQHHAAHAPVDPGVGKLPEFA